MKILSILWMIIALIGVSSSNCSAAVGSGCQVCHAIVLDKNHTMACVACHQGNEKAGTKTAAHAGLVGRPAHPLQMKKNCGSCHQQLVASVADSLHFTLRKEINSVRTAFGAADRLNSLLEIPIHNEPATMLELADDLLRRRCLRCHVYYAGDNYPAVRHGTGCAACHMRFRDGRLQSHAFVGLPADEQCLHCHYGNVVGFDYYGRFEHDYNTAYRTPFAVKEAGRNILSRRPYGIEYHQLRPDIHQIKGLSCIDCHPGVELMGGGHGRKATGKISCATCHLRPSTGKAAGLSNLVAVNGVYFLIDKQTGSRHRIPMPVNPAHKTYGAGVACVVCHAQWSFNDKGKHLMRQDVDDYEPWALLTVQGSFEVEELLENNLYYLSATEYLPPRMTDKISGAVRPGLWYKGYERRRWEDILLNRDADGRLKIFRPVLDLHLSYVNEKGKVVFNSIGNKDAAGGMRPYTPHTVGKAGLFFRQRLNRNFSINRRNQ